ncbi:hypothetical protein [Dichotomicrobium thermohalophilum]|uniref:Uncharacterized protein n=1 Tax=Dichotomicrobium thermohalophilum TaxID=933063 RepID=A0A397Q5J0_9HYPH|nr:hypothetical protein [Dichotomicrobium thermohalophilum]RIA56750.1 hypothetical protein BXY53_1859 [Dichotomicrobium thermohalophilum]
MSQKVDLTHQAQDTLIAGGLISAPAWAPWLAKLNELLTTLSLVLGLALASARLWAFLRDRQRDRDPDA